MNVKKNSKLVESIKRLIVDCFKSISFKIKYYLSHKYDLNKINSKKEVTSCLLKTIIDKSSENQGKNRFIISKKLRLTREKNFDINSIQAAECFILRKEENIINPTSLEIKPSDISIEKIMRADLAVKDKDKLNEQLFN